MNSLGDYVRERRLSLGWTLIETAERADLTKSELSALEHNKIKLPGADKRRRLADALGVRHIDLLVAAGELRPDEVPGPHQPKPNPNDPVEKLADLLRMIDLDVYRRQQFLERMLLGYLEEDRRDGRVTEWVADEPRATG